MEKEDKILKFIKHQAWLVWLSGLSANLRTKGLPVRFTVRAHAWDSGQVPGGGGVRDITTHCVLSLFLPPFPSL